MQVCFLIKSTCDGFYYFIRLTDLTATQLGTNIWRKVLKFAFFVSLTELRQPGKRAFELYAQSESVALGFSLTIALNQLSKASPRCETPSISFQAWDRHLAVPLRDRGGHRHLPAAVLPSGKIPDAAPMLDWKEKHPIDKQTTRTNGEGFTKKDEVHFLTDQCDWNRIRRKVFFSVQSDFSIF